MARRSSRDNSDSDDDLSDYDRHRGNRSAPRPTRSDREPEYDTVRKRAVPPPSNRRSRDIDDSPVVEERQPPANRDPLERRPPANRDRGSWDRADGRERDPPRDRERERGDSRSASRDRPVERSAPHAREQSGGSSSRSRERDYDETSRQGRPPPIRTSREPDESRGGGGSRHSSRDRGDSCDRGNSRDRRNSRDRGDRGSRNDSRDRYQDDDDEDSYGRSQVRESRDRSVRSSRDDPRRSREAPKGFTPKSYVRANGTPPAAAWDAPSGINGRQFEKENTRPHDRGDTWASSVKHRAPPSVMRSSYRADEESDEEEEDSRQLNRRSNSTRVNRHISSDRLEPGIERDRADSRDRDRSRARAEYDDEEQLYRGRGGNDRDRDGRGQDTRERPSNRERQYQFDAEESQDNDITPFSLEKPKKKADQAVRRQLDSDEEVTQHHGRERDDSRERRDRDRGNRDRSDSNDRSDSRGANGKVETRRLEMEYDEEEDEYGYSMTTWGSDQRKKEKNISEGNARKWEGDGGQEDGISSTDMQRLENFRKSGRYGGADGEERSKKAGYNYRPAGNVPLVHYCPPNGGNTDLFQCYIVRERNSISSKLYPTYKLFSQEGDKLLILARKMGMNSTSNYHLFDMTRGIPEKTQLSKKSGNYIGKLRGIDTNHSEYVLVTKSEEKHEVAAIKFDHVGLVSQLKEGCQPRKMSILLPNINADNEPIPHQLKHTDSSKKKPKSLATLLRRNEIGNMFNLVSKDPIYENGNYRLNFHGRVSIPSVKNFQLTSEKDIDDVICQFGKIGDETFNLDFKYPLNPFQAFSLALCHFDA